MLKLYYCDSIYGDRIQDLNPLIPQAYPKKDILIICAREGQQIRLNKQQGNFVVASWWDAEQFNDIHKLQSFDVVVILDRDRIDPLFHKMLLWVEQNINASY